MTHVFTSKCKFFLSLITLLSISISSFGQQFEENSTTLQGTSIGIGTSLDVIDPALGNGGVFTDLDTYSFVELSIDSSTPLNTDFECTVRLSITATLDDGSQGVPYEKELMVSQAVNNNGGPNTIDVAYHPIINARGVAISIIDISTTTVSGSSPVAPDNVTIQVGFKTERYTPLDPQAPSIDIDGVVDNELILEWSPVDGALTYELEWTWIDNYGPDPENNPTLSAASISLTSREFELNNTRVETKGQSYRIPLVYDRGYIAYRVRSVGRFMDDVTRNYYGNWSYAGSINSKLSSWNPFLVTAHDRAKNWQYQASYAEDGKSKEVVSYFDGTLRNRQTVTTINSDVNAIVGEVVYDAQGRPAIEILPVPVEDNILGYHNNVNVNINNVPYNKYDFDWEQANESCEVTASPLAIISGSSQYYGPKPSSGNYQDFVPDAQGYPFSQIEYTNDNTGRINRKGGVGLKHQLGENHEMKYLYSIPSQGELNRLFGYHVGNASHYKKNVVVDPNGQVSVSYIDPQGRTIATALSADAPDQLDVIEGGDTDANDLTTDLLNKLSINAIDTNEDNNILYASGFYGPIQDGLKYEGQKVFTADGYSYTFQYDVSGPAAFSEICPTNSAEGYPFVYTLYEDVLDNCGASQLTSDGLINETVQIGEYNTSLVTGEINGEVVAVDLVNLINTESILLYENTTSKVLNTGAYNIIKDLKVDEEVLEFYAEDYITRLQLANDGCLLSPDQLSPSATSSGCYATCQECVDLFMNGNTTEAAAIEEYVNTNLASWNIEGLTPEEIEALEVRFETEWYLFIEACQSSCVIDGIEIVGGDNDSSESIESVSCESKKVALLSDMKPSGQYGIQGGDNGAQLNVFDPNNLLGGNFQEPQHYSYNTDPNHYFDENGDISYITISFVNGSYSPAVLNENLIFPDSQNPNVLITEPQNLDIANIPDFIETYWRDSWSESLVVYHPEYQYFLYAQGICGMTLSRNDIDADGDGTNDDISWNSDGYEAYLLGLSFDEGFAFFGSSTTELMNRDPYFSGAITFDGYTESPQDFNLRKAIMNEALTENYQSTNISLSAFSYSTIVCNNISACNVSNQINLSQVNSDDDIEDKNLYWQTYIGNYLSLKASIQYVFLNRYALQEGSYNGCIGDEDPQDDLWQVVRDYDVSQDDINIDQTVDGLCQNDTLVPLLLNKQKRFEGIDNLYDSEQSDQAIVEALEDETDYAYYAQTGQCPMARDLEVYLNGIVNISTTNGTPVNLNSSSLGAYNGLYLTTDLFRDFGYMGNIPLSVDLGITAAVNGLELEIGLNDGETSPVSLSLPTSGAQFNWSNYGSWYITTFSNLVYVDYSQSTGLFSFQILATIAEQGSDDTVEVVLSGTTIARIGECVGGSETDANGNPIDGPGEVLDDTSYNDCDRKDRFETSLKNLMEGLADVGQLNSSSPYEINSLLTNTNSFIPELFDIASSSQVTWQYFSGNGGVFGLSVDDVSVFSFSPQVIGNFALADNDEINYIYINGVVNSQGNYEVNLEIERANGSIITLTDSLINSANPIEFSCCTVISNDKVKPDCPPSYETVCSETESELIFESYYLQALNELLNTDGQFIYGEETPLIQDFQEFADLEIRLQAQAVLNSQSLPDNFMDLGDFVFGLNEQGETSMSWSDAGFSRPPFGGFDLQMDITREFTRVCDFSILENPVPIPGDPYPSGGLLNVSLSGYNLNGDYVTIDSTLEIVVIGDIDSGPTNGFPEVNTYDFCNFFTLSTAPSNGGTTTNPLSANSRGDTCEYCIPQVVTPVSCTEQWQPFLNIVAQIDGDINDDGIVSIDEFGAYILPAIYTQEYFCDLNYAYLVESYQLYVNTFNITHTGDPQFLTIAEFGATPLNYGFNKIDEVINAYATSVDDSGENATTWASFAADYLILNPDSCPPAPFFPTIDLIVQIEESPCETFELSVSQAYDQEAYANYLEQIKLNFKKAYLDNALQYLNEHFNLTYGDKEYQYTLYYYDQAGNLAQTVSPEGVDRLDANDVSLNDAINVHRYQGETTEQVTLLPEHTLETQYRYNSLNQLVWQQTPDGGITVFAYDDLGRIIASQNAKQAIPIDEYEKPAIRFSYTEYDGLGRITEAGETIDIGQAYAITPEGRLKRGNLLINSFDHSVRKEVTTTIYDVTIDLSSNSSTNFLSSGELFEDFNAAQGTLRNRVGGILYFKEIPDTAGGDNFNHGLFYDYDIHGNVKELVSIYVDERDDTVINRIKHVYYEYDLISGNVHRVTFQKGESDQFIHAYAYDADNRITQVETSKDGYLWEKDATYQYYKHGPLARMELGDKKVQGQDYVYTLQGWLKSVNGEYITDPNGDFGKDGTVGSIVARDAFGYSLGYFNGDYDAVAGNTEDYFSLSSPSVQNLYNGNIKQMVTSLRGLNGSTLPSQVNTYDYDQLNRIKAMRSESVVSTNNSPGARTPSFESAYSYDRNGNLETLSRKAEKNGVFIPMDDLTYEYKTGTNQLTLVRDGVAAGTFDVDLDDQEDNIGIAYSESNEASHNYKYDEIGQLIQDYGENLRIYWRVDGKVDYIIKGVNQRAQSRIEFEYDGLGNRVAKRSINPLGQIVSITFYARDAQGNVMATYQDYSEAQGGTGEYPADIGPVAATITNTVDEKATNTITMSGPSFPYTIEDTGDVSLTASTFIVFKPGFHSKANSALHAKIEEVVSSGPSFTGVVEHHLYGSSRLGLEVTYMNETENESTSTDPTTILMENTVGDKRYELSNHLGNVLSVVTDKKIPIFSGGSLTHYNPEIVAYNDYYPFGMLLPNRHANTSDYRYGFQGQELDNEIKGEGNSHNYTFRMSDPRVGRFFTTDPLESKFPWYSPYQFAGNKVILFTELEGLEEKIPEIQNTIYAKSFYNPKLDMDMSDVGSSAQTLNGNKTIATSYTLKGGARNYVAYWNKQVDANPEMFNAANKAKIKNGAAPTINDQWIKHNPQHAEYKGDKLIHHHKYQGKVATAIPETVHNKFSKNLHPFRKVRAKISSRLTKVNLKGGLAKIGTVLTVMTTAIDFISEDPNSTWNQTFGNGLNVGQLYSQLEPSNLSAIEGAFYVVNSREKHYDTEGSYTGQTANLTEFYLIEDGNGNVNLEEGATSTYYQGKDDKKPSKMNEP